MVYRFLPLLLAACCAAAPAAEPRILFDGEARRWTLNNGAIEAVFDLTPANRFEFRKLVNLATGDTWTPDPLVPTSPVRFATDSSVLDARTEFQLSTGYVEALSGGGRRQVIVLEDLRREFEVRVMLDMHPDQPAFRHTAVIRNLKPVRVRVRTADMVPWTLAAPSASYRAFQVAQWALVPAPRNFETVETPIEAGAAPVEVRGGSRGLHCTWLALRSAEDAGLFLGWEFDGRADLSVARAADGGTLQFAAGVLDLNHPVDPGGEFQVPAGFVGVFRGDWDEAGYQTQRYVEAAIAMAPPDADRFPFVAWDSWGYHDALEERTLRQSAEVAARLGVELFVVDLGWARSIGDWRHDPVKFPSGLKALSDYVHSLGMKFGLHLALAEAASGAPVLLENPDWTSSETYNYFGALSLCLSNRPTRDWLVADIIRVIDEYGVDWILQDGENMVKTCTKASHTHDPRDSNYSNSVEGLNTVLAEVQRRRPETHWENCENGGNMMTFNMVRHYVTSITNDASGALAARQAAYGATYPFPPRYADRYMVEETFSPEITRSYLFGGPWVLMNRIGSMSASQMEQAAAEIRYFKEVRDICRNGKVFHLTARPGEQAFDAIQTYSTELDSAAAVVHRDGGPSGEYVVYLQGLRPYGLYEVRFANSDRVLTMTGTEIARDGVHLSMPRTKSAEIVFVTPL